MNRFEHFCDPFAPGFGIINSFQESLIFQKLPGGQVFVSTEFLRQITDQSLQFFPFFLGIDAIEGSPEHKYLYDAIDEYFSIALLEYAADDTHKGGFTCTVRS